jgi:hypothetical protein
MISTLTVYVHARRSIYTHFDARHRFIKIRICLDQFNDRRDHEKIRRSRDWSHSNRSIDFSRWVSLRSKSERKHVFRKIEYQTTRYLNIEFLLRWYENFLMFYCSWNRWDVFFVRRQLNSLTTNTSYISTNKAKKLNVKIIIVRYV